jgi:hypothetical protein
VVHARAAGIAMLRPVGWRRGRLTRSGILQLAPDRVACRDRRVPLARRTLAFADRRIGLAESGIAFPDPKIARPVRDVTLVERPSYSGNFARKGCM